MRPKSARRFIVAWDNNVPASAISEIWGRLTPTDRAWLLTSAGACHYAAFDIGRIQIDYTPGMLCIHILNYWTLPAIEYCLLTSKTLQSLNLVGVQIYDLLPLIETRHAWSIWLQALRQSPDHIFGMVISSLKVPAGPALDHLYEHAKERYIGPNMLRLLAHNAMPEHLNFLAIRDEEYAIHVVERHDCLEELRNARVGNVHKWWDYANSQTRLAEPSRCAIWLLGHSVLGRSVFVKQRDGNTVLCVKKERPPLYSAKMLHCAVIGFCDGWLAPQSIPQGKTWPDRHLRFFRLLQELPADLHPQICGLAYGINSETLPFNARCFGIMMEGWNP